MKQQYTHTTSIHLRSKRHCVWVYVLFLPKAQSQVATIYGICNMVSITLTSITKQRISCYSSPLKSQQTNCSALTPIHLHLTRKCVCNGRQLSPLTYKIWDWHFMCQCVAYISLFDIYQTWHHVERTAARCSICVPPPALWPRHCSGWGIYFGGSGPNVFAGIYFLHYAETPVAVAAIWSCIVTWSKA